MHVSSWDLTLACFTGLKMVKLLHVMLDAWCNATDEIQQPKAQKLLQPQTRRGNLHEHKPQLRKLKKKSTAERDRERKHNFVFCLADRQFPAMARKIKLISQLQIQSILINLH